MKNYKILSANNPVMLETQVQQLMNQYLSWTPIGGVTVVVDANGRETFYQAMVY